MQGIHLKPHQILSQPLPNSLILRNAFTGMGDAFNFSALSFWAEWSPDSETDGATTNLILNLIGYLNAGSS